MLNNFIFLKELQNIFIKMGEFLSQPNKDKHSHDGENSFVRNNLNNIYKIIIVKIWFI